MEKIIKKRNVSLIALIIISIVSMLFSKVASSKQFHADTIKILDDKKIVVMELTAATALTATAITAIPGEGTTPLANKIMDLSSYLLIIIGAIFLEKILLTLTGNITFGILIPLACLLCGINLFIKKEMLKQLAIKLVIFGIAIFMVVPTSVKISDWIEKNHQTEINQVLEETKETPEKEETKKEGWGGIISNIKEFTSKVGDNVSEWINKGKNALNDFMDAIAILLITSCVIPIIVLLIFIVLIKGIFGININFNNIKKGE